MYARSVDPASLLAAAGFALAVAIVVREILMKGVPGTRRQRWAPAERPLPTGSAQQARRRLAGLLLAYSFSAGRIGRESSAAGSAERAGEYAAEYDEASFRDKLRTAARNAGSAVVERALALRYVAVSAETPAWARECAHAALGYFIVPLDAIPDAAPAGFCDDLAVLATALRAVAAYVTPALRARAARKARKVCGLAEGPPDALNRPPAGEWPPTAL